MPLRYLPDAEQCCFKKGEYLIRQGEKLDFLYYLTLGTVHRVYLSSEGKEATISIEEAENGGNYLRSLIGVLVLYDCHQQYSIPNCSFVAHTDCICYRIPLDSYRTFEAQHKEEVLTQLLSFVMDSYQEFLDMRSTMFHKNASALLCTHILNYITQLNNRAVYEKKVCQTETAKLLGIHPVNVSKIFNTLIKKGILEDNETYYTILDKESLEAVAAGSFELSYVKS